MKSVRSENRVRFKKGYGSKTCTTRKQTLEEGLF